MITLLSKLGDRLASIETKMTKLNQSDRRESFKATMKRTDSEPVKERRISIEPETTPYSSLLLPQRSAQKSKEELLSQRLKLKNELRSKISHDDAQEKDEAWKWWLLNLNQIFFPLSLIIFLFISLRVLLMRSLSIASSRLNWGLLISISSTISFLPVYLFHSFPS